MEFFILAPPRTVLLSRLIGVGHVLSAVIRPSPLVALAPLRL